MDDYELVAKELIEHAEKMRGFDERLAEVEKVNARLEEAALTTARALARSRVTGTRCTTPCAAQTKSMKKSRPSATATQRRRVDASHRGSRVGSTLVGLALLARTPAESP